MRREEIYRIDGKLVAYHDHEINCVVDVWENLMVSIDQFERVICNIGLDYARDFGLKIWVVDLTHTSGVFKRDVQDYIESTVAPRFSESGIEFFFLVLPNSALSKLSARQITKTNAQIAQKSGKVDGMQTIEVESIEEIKEFLSQLLV